tara:strand:- start:24 stop:710 length:687 start_codon:yes stop_codon:yes gene_type:complete
MTRAVNVLGQAVIKYDAPQHILDEVNKVYDERKIRDLPATNKFLAGKIKDEFTLYHNEMNDASQNFNNLSTKSLDWFQNQFQDYLGVVEKKSVTIRLSSIWVNEMYANEYNPVHTHSSRFSKIGLSSVMMLKLPSNYGKEYSRPDNPLNGQLQFVGNGGGQFAFTDFRPDVKIGDFYVFPYDMRHCVYPFNTTKEHRRTLAANVDVFYRPGYAAALEACGLFPQNIKT